MIGIPGTITISFFRVLSLRSLRSSLSSMLSTNPSALDTNAKTILAISSTCLVLEFSFIPIPYLPSFLVASIVAISPDSSVVVKFTEAEDGMLLRRPLLRIIDPSDFERISVD